jgi:glyceraldehyde-3-phosphate dehydrogenase (NAD(P))
MNVLVNGIGNIGKTLLEVLLKYKDELEIDNIYALKNTPQPWVLSELNDLEERGIKVCTRTKDEFENFDGIKNSIEYIFDCTNNGGGIRNKVWYEELPNLKGASAQGSEKNFGVSYMSGTNNEAIQNEKFVHVVSCNTHSIASILQTFCGKNLSNLIESDFVIVRRSEDIGNHQRLVSANVVARHLDDQLGTHHSIDVLDLYKTIGVNFKVTSSDITTPSQLMHGVRFNIRMNTEMKQKDIDKAICQNSFVSTSTTFDSNVIFERGRRHSFQGRIFSHAIIISNNILSVDNSLKGWAFIPQEGNTILSTIHAFLLQTNSIYADNIMESIKESLLKDNW